MQKRNHLLVVLISTFLCSCTPGDNSVHADPFAGNWQGSGTDSQENAFVFAAKVIALGEGRYRMLVLDSIDTQKEPIHIMEGVLKDGAFPYTADNGLYTGSGTLKGDTFEGYYKGPVDGAFTMTRME